MLFAPMSDFLWLDLPANVLELCSHRETASSNLSIFFNRKCIFSDVKSNKPETVGTAPT